MDQLISGSLVSVVSPKGPTNEESGESPDAQMASEKVRGSPGIEPLSSDPIILTPIENLPSLENTVDTRRRIQDGTEEETQPIATASPDRENKGMDIQRLEPKSRIGEVHSTEELSRQPRRPSMKYLSSFQDHIVNPKWRPDQNVEENESQDPEEKKVVSELLETEKAYVNRLHLLDQVFYSELMAEAQSKKTFPEEVVKLIFSNISSIYQFHGLFFLPELQQRMDEWISNPRIGDIIQKLAPFLKMYAEYIKNFEKAMELITLWMEKCQPFQDIVIEIEKREVSSNLSLCHHMLEPVQRVPRYELLLKEYLKKLPPQSLDRTDTEKALAIIFSAAKHSNAAIAEMERLRRLWEVYERLGVEEDIVDPSNELIKEGPVQKISLRRSSVTTERYLFLFNNMLLYCVPKVIQVGSEYQIRMKIDVNGMKVKQLKDTEFPHVFLISGKQRSLELQARSQEEADSWIQACEDAIDRSEKRYESFKTAFQGPDGKSEELGRRAPQWIRDNLVTMCMRCKEPFHPITRRRHHCRACGYVVCGKCSDYKAELMYDEKRLNRVCLECFTFLTGNLINYGKEERKKGILEVRGELPKMVKEDAQTTYRAKEVECHSFACKKGVIKKEHTQKESAAVSGKSLMCSFLQLLDKSGKVGTRSWCVIPKDDHLILYMFAAPQDVKAHTSIPLLGYEVKDLQTAESRHLFQLVQSKQLYTFLAESEEVKRRWLTVITLVASGENVITGEENDSLDEMDIHRESLN